MKITVAIYQLHFCSFVTKPSHYSVFNLQNNNNKKTKTKKNRGKHLEDVITWIMIPTMESGRGVCVGRGGGMYFEMLLMNGIDEISKSVRLSMSQSHLAHCSEMYTDNTGVGKLV